MLKSIVIGVDGSPGGTAAIEVGIAWAQQFDAAVFGFGVIDQPTICRPEAVPLGGMAFKGERDAALLAEASQRVERALQVFSARCIDAGVSGGAFEATGLPAEEILLEAQRYDLILLGQRTHSHSEAQQGATDTLRDIVKHSPRPVVAVPEKPREGTSMIVAYDGSFQAARTLHAFVGTGLSGSQMVHVVCVHPDQAEGLRRADRAIEYLRFHEITATSHVVASSSPPLRTILEHVDALDAGLLIMGAYGQTMLREFFFGSVTRNALNESSVPIFLYH